MQVIEIKSEKDCARLRRLALSAQGLLQNQAYGKGVAGAINSISHIGYVQIDTISVVERAHNHVLRSRVPDYQPAMLNELLVNRDIFEYWTHAAAFIPIEDYRFSLPYKQAIKNGQVHWYKKPDRKLIKELLARIRTDGALRSRDLEENDKKNSSGWWDLKPAKKALEQLYMEGELMVSNRDGFQKSYDLTERVLPSHIDTRFPSIEAFAKHLIEQQLHCHAVVSLKGFTYLRKNTELRKTVKAQIESALTSGELAQIKLKTGELFVVRAGALEAPLPRVSNRLSILSPFDNSVIQRDRLKALFEFDYQIECYVPEAKRQYGYFSLPLLFRDMFIGRMDCKAHRKTRELEIKSLHFEKHSFDVDLVLGAFAKAIESFRDFQGCDSIYLNECHPKRLTRSVHETLNLIG